MWRYHTVLFDADNTLFDFSRAEQEALCNTLRFFKITPTKEMVVTYSRINDAMWKKLERGELTKEALREARFAEFATAIGVSFDVHAVSLQYTDFLAEQQDLIEGALEVVRKLSAHCKLYIITNGIKTVQKKRFANSLLKPYFEDIFVSEELGFEKPHIGFFSEVARRIKNFSPQDTLIVGDSLTSDIKGGINAGIDTCWYNPKNCENSENLPITYRIQALEDLVPLMLSE